MPSTVALTTYPTSRADADETKSSQLFSSIISNGVIRNITNTMQVYADATGMQVKVKTGRCVFNGFWADIAAEQILSVASADPSNPRIDLVVAELVVTSPATISVKVVTGTPNVSPAAPTASATQLALATVRVNAGVSSILVGNVTDARTYAAAQTVGFSSGGIEVSRMDTDGTVYATASYVAENRAAWGFRGMRPRGGEAGAIELITSAGGNTNPFVVIARGDSDHAETMRCDVAAQTVRFGGTVMTNATQCVIGIGNTSIGGPTGNPSQGGYLYSEAGALKWRGPAGSITTIAPA